MGIMHKIREICSVLYEKIQEKIVNCTVVVQDTRVYNSPRNDKGRQVPVYERGRMAERVRYYSIITQKWYADIIE